MDSSSMYVYRVGSALLVCAASFFIGNGCSDPVDPHYKSAIEDGKKSGPIVSNFVREFPAARHRITYFTGEYGKPSWTSRTGLYGRYVLAVEIEIKLEPKNGKILSWGEPKFSLFEVAGIEFNPKDRTETITPGDISISFGLAEWQKIIAHHGDVEVLGVTLKKNQPVAGFEDYLERN